MIHIESNKVSCADFPLPYYHLIDVRISISLHYVSPVTITPK